MSCSSLHKQIDFTILYLSNTKATKPLCKDIRMLIISYCAEFTDNILFQLLCSNTISKENVRQLLPIKTIASILISTKKHLLNDANIINIKLNKNGSKLKDEKLIIFGDIRGNLYCLKKLLYKSVVNRNQKIKLNNWLYFRLCSFIYSNKKYLFLGSYIGNNSNAIHSFEVMITLCILKTQFPESVFLLHGYTEQLHMAIDCAFVDELNQTFTNYNKLKLDEINVNTCYDSFFSSYDLSIHCEFDEMYKLIHNNDKQMKDNEIKLIFDMIQIVFYCLPYICVINTTKENIICIPGGLSPQLDDINDLNDKIYCRPNIVSTCGGVIWEIASSEYNNEKSVDGWTLSNDGNFAFHEQLLPLFLKANNCAKMISSHIIIPNGYKIYNYIYTIFSCLNCNGQHNNAAIVVIDSQAQCKFIKIKQ